MHCHLQGTRRGHNSKYFLCSGVQPIPCKAGRCLPDIERATRWGSLADVITAHPLVVPCVRELLGLRCYISQNRTSHHQTEVAGDYWSRLYVVSQALGTYKLPLSHWIRARTSGARDGASKASWIGTISKPTNSVSFQDISTILIGAPDIPSTETPHQGSKLGGKGKNRGVIEKINKPTSKLYHQIV